MARRTHNRKISKGTTALRKRVANRFKRAPRTTPEQVPSTIFWPDRIDHVKAIAMRGLTDDEMATIMGVSSELLASWKAYYPQLDKAISEGRMAADAQVVAALHSNAVGYTKTSDEVVRTRRGAQVVQVEKYYPAETNAQKYWLNNRAPSYWGDKVQLGGDRSPGAKAIGVKDETKHDIINSLINMIRPQPDNG